mmetsp:Transcript_11124/g.26767  ORF Transcript_11124/g.26767 Transcript_11124/m.26767 type:complete len:254 (+) Transcript_11124:1381-2142(+)
MSTILPRTRRGRMLRKAARSWEGCLRGLGRASAAICAEWMHSRRCVSIIWQSGCTTSHSSVSSTYFSNAAYPPAPPAPPAPPSAPLILWAACWTTAPASATAAMRRCSWWGSRQLARSSVRKRGRRPRLQRRKEQSQARESERATDPSISSFFNWSATSSTSPSRMSFLGSMSQHVFTTHRRARVLGPLSASDMTVSIASISTLDASLFQPLFLLVPTCVSTSASTGPTTCITCCWKKRWICMICPAISDPLR